MSANAVPLLVGELNPYGADPHYALFCEPEHSAGGRMCRLVCALRRPTYLALHRVNLCDGRWSMKSARAKAEKLTLTGAPWNVVVMLGRKVADAFGYRDGFFSVRRDEVFTLVSLPHPSGLCREWNRPHAFQTARSLLQEACPDVPWGEAVRLAG